MNDVIFDQWPRIFWPVVISIAVGLIGCDAYRNVASISVVKVKNESGRVISEFKMSLTDSDGNTVIERLGEIGVGVQKTFRMKGRDVIVKVESFNLGDKTFSLEDEEILITPSDRPTITIHNGGAIGIEYE